MNTHVAVAEAFLNVIRTLPKQEKKLIVERLLSDYENEFTKEEWKKIEKLTKDKVRVCHSAKEAKEYLNSLR